MKKGAAQYQFSKMTSTDSTAVRTAINKNIPFEVDSFKKGIANPSTYGYHHNRFAYSDAKRNASGIGSGGTVRGGEAALSSYNRYRTDKETAATTLKNLTSEFGSTAISGIREEMVVGPKLNNRVNPQQEFLKPNPKVENLKQGAPQVKFDTTAHDYGKRAAKMTPEERTEYREGAKIAVSFAPIGGVLAKLASKIMTNVPKIAKAVKATVTKPRAIDTWANTPATKTLLKPKNPRMAAKAKGDMSYLSIAKADKSAYAKMSKGEKAAYDHPAAKTFRETGKTPTDVFRETGKNTVKDLEKIFKKYDTPSGYYTPDVKLMGKGGGAPQ